MRRFCAALLLALALSPAPLIAGGSLSLRMETTGGKPGAQTAVTHIECVTELDEYCAKLEQGWRTLYQRNDSGRSEAGVADGATFRATVRLPGSTRDQKWEWTGTVRGAPEEFRRWRELVEEDRTPEEYSRPAQLDCQWSKEASKSSALPAPP